MKTPRRTRRSHTDSIVLTERDVEILTLASVCGYVHTGQIERTFFPGASDACRKRLRKLFNHGYVQVTLSDSRFPNLWSVTRLGLGVVEVSHGGSVAGARTSGAIRPDAIRHHVATADVRLAVRALADAGLVEFVAWHGGRSDPARSLGFARHGLVPDALVQVDTPHVRWLAIEVDVGTETRSGVLLAKLERYRRLLNYSPAGAVELWLVDAAPTRRGIEPVARRAGLAGSVRCFAVADLVRRPVAPIPRTLAGVSWLHPYNAGARGQVDSSFHHDTAQRPSADTTVDGRADK